MLGTYPSADVSLSGVAPYTRSLVAALEELGEPVLVLAQRRPAPKAARVTPAWESGWKLASSVKGCLRRHRVDVVHLQHEPFLFGGGVGLLMALDLPRLIVRSGATCFMTLHAVPFPSLLRDRSSKTAIVRGLSVPYLRAIRRASRWVDTFVVHEPDQAETLTRFGMVPKAQIAVIPHGVTIASTEAVNTKEAPRPRDRHFTVGTFGYLTPYKDPEYLIDEFVRFRRAFPQTSLLFSLSTHPRRRYQWRYSRIIGRASKTPAVEVRGHIPDTALVGFLARCDVVVAPHKYSVSASGVAAAAIGAGVPVLVPEGSGEVSRLDGWSFQPRSGGLADALARQAEHVEEMRALARRLAAERSWTRVAEAHQGLYRQVGAAAARQWSLQ